MKIPTKLKIWLENNIVLTILLTVGFIYGAIFIHPAILLLVPFYILVEMWYFEKRYSKHLKLKYEELLRKVKSKNGFQPG